MRQSTINALDGQFARYPFLRAKDGATQEEIRRCFGRLGAAFNDSYAEFLERYGSGMVGPFPVFGLKQAEGLGTAWNVEVLTHQFWEDRWAGASNWVIVSMDHGGNPFGLAADGAVWLSDHDFGEVVKVAESFEQFLRVVCLKMGD